MAEAYGCNLPEHKRQPPSMTCQHSCTVRYTNVMFQQDTLTMQMIIRLGFCLMSSLATPAFAAAKGCMGTFLQDSQGYLASEGGAEPTDDRRKKGEQGEFLYFDIMDGERYVRLKEGDEHKAALVTLKAGCKLPKLRAGGKY